MTGIWGTVITVVLMLVEWWLKKQNANAEALASFYRFVHSVNVNHLDTVKAGQSWRRQANDLAAELDRQEQQKKLKALPVYSRPECLFEYCPNSKLCMVKGCQHKK